MMRGLSGGLGCVLILIALVVVVGGLFDGAIALTSLN